MNDQEEKDLKKDPQSGEETKEVLEPNTPEESPAEPSNDEATPEVPSEPQQPAEDLKQPDPAEATPPERPAILRDPKTGEPLRDQSPGRDNGWVGGHSTGGEFVTDKPDDQVAKDLEE